MNTLDQLYSMYIEFIKVLDIYNDLNNICYLNFHIYFTPSESVSSL